MSAPETAIVVPVEPPQADALAVTDAPQAPAVYADQPQNVLAVISTLAANPNVDPNVVAKYLELYERLDARRCEQAYKEALARLQAKLPQITRDGVIDMGTKGRIKYAKLENIDITIRPMLAEEGFSFSFGSDSADGKLYNISGKLSHREGHSEEFHIHLPIVLGPGRNAVQAVAWTLTYARRQLIKMALNVVEKDEDVDGGDLEKLGGEQLKDLKSFMEEVAADEKRFLKFMDVEKLDQILVRDLQKAITSLEHKRRRGQ